MTTIEDIRSREASGYPEQLLIGLGEKIPNEKLRQMVRYIALEHLQLNRITEEFTFLMNLAVIALFPQEGSKQEVINKVVKQLGVQPKELQKSIMDFHQTLEFLHYKQGYAQVTEKMIADTADTLSQQPGKFYICTDKDIAEITRQRFELSAKLNKIAQKFETLSVQEWAVLQKLFEEKQLPFSHDFIIRCQLVALKAISA